MPPIQTLKRRPEFLAVNGAFRVAKPGFVLLARQRGEDARTPGELARFGLTVTKKIGNAVVRNRARRRLRALACAALPARGEPGWDYVFVAREGAVTRDFSALAGDLESALEMLHKARGSAGAAPARGKGVRDRP